MIQFQGVDHRLFNTTGTAAAAGQLLDVWHRRTEFSANHTLCASVDRRSKFSSDLFHRFFPFLLLYLSPLTSKRKREKERAFQSKDYN